VCYTLSGGIVNVFLGSGSGSLTLSGNYPSGPIVNMITSDLNNDANLDLIGLTTSGAVVMLGNGTGGFAAPTSFTVGSAPISFVVKDFNIDGNLDLAVANKTSLDVRVFIGNGTGAFSPLATYTLGGTPTHLDYGDFNGDAKGDLLVSMGSNFQVKLFNGIGNGTFTFTANSTIISQPQMSKSGDFNGDGNLDFATVTSSTNGLHIYLGNGVGTFTLANTYTAFVVNSLPQLIISDLDVDGKLDIAQTDYREHLLIYYGQGNGSFVLSHNLDAIAPNNRTLDFGDFNSDGYSDFTMVNAGDFAVGLIISNGKNNYHALKNIESPIGSSIDVDVADFNNDGIVDLASVIYNGIDYVSIFNGYGDGNFMAPSSFSVPSLGSSASSAIAAGDLNLDGNIDLAVSNATNLNVYIGNGTGSFSLTSILPITNFGYDLVLKDLNQDLFPDIVLSSAAATTSISVRLNTGTGNFMSAVNYSVGSQPRAVAIGDINSDGFEDIVSANYSSNNITLLAGNGLGTFTVLSTLSGGNQPSGIKIGDFNNDAIADIACTNNSGIGLFVYLGTGAGTFSSPSSYTIGLSPQGIDVSDFNNDGNKDIVTCNTGGSNVSVLLGNGLGTFTASTSFLAGAVSKEVISIDLNSDGKTDIVTSNWGDNNISALLNFSSPKILATNSTTLCSGGSVTLKTDKGPYFYNWQPGGSTADSVVVTASGIYSVTISNLTGICSVTSNTIAVIFSSLPYPTVTIGATSNTLCSGQTVSLTANGASTYSWNTGPTTNTISVTPLTATNYSVTGINSVGCAGTSTILITVNPTPTVTAISSTSILCTGNSATLSANGAITYTWDTGPNSLSIVISPTINTTYTVIGTNSFGCDNFSIITQTVSTCSGVQNYSGDFSVLIVPNPAPDEVKLILSNVNENTVFEIYDLIGRKLVEKEITLSGTIIAIGQLASGIYDVRIKSNSNYIFQTKLVKE
jgi:hypothetical protein